MVAHCAIVTCKNSASIPDWQEYFSLHRLPRDEKVKNRWLKKLKPYYKCSNNLSNFRICTKHFLPEHYTVHCDSNGPKKRQLHLNAMPKLLLYELKKEVKPKQPKPVPMPESDYSENSLDSNIPLKDLVQTTDNAEQPKTTMMKYRNHSLMSCVQKRYKRLKMKVTEVKLKKTVRRVVARAAAKKKNIEILHKEYCRNFGFVTMKEVDQYKDEIQQLKKDIASLTEKSQILEEELKGLRETVAQKKENVIVID